MSNICPFLPAKLFKLCQVSWGVAVDSKLETLPEITTWVFRQSALAHGPADKLPSLSFWIEAASISQYLATFISPSTLTRFPTCCWKSRDAFCSVPYSARASATTFFSSGWLGAKILWVLPHVLLTAQWFSFTRPSCELHTQPGTDGNRVLEWPDWVRTWEPSLRSLALMSLCHQGWC